MSAIDLGKNPPDPCDDCSMGRKRWTTRRTVEQCSIGLSVVWLHRLARLFSRMPGASTTLTLRDRFNGALLARIDCELRYREHKDMAILIRADDADGAALGSGQMIPIVTTRPYFGGERFWFKCECGRRVGWLYLPQGAPEFQCRLCHNLSYRTVQEHDQRINRIARSFSEIDAAFHDPKIMRRLMALRALRVWAKRQAFLKSCYP